MDVPLGSFTFALLKHAINETLECQQTALLHEEAARMFARRLDLSQCGPKLQIKSLSQWTLATVCPIAQGAAIFGSAPIS
jgi:hypothetical protein